MAPATQSPRWAGRYYIPALPQEHSSATIKGPQAAHAAGSRRARPKDAVTLFDGTGFDLEATVLAASKARLILETRARRLVGPPLSVPVTLASALPKGSREDILVAQCAQLGVSRLVPLAFARTVADPRKNWPKKRSRFARLAIEAAKQSGASTLMDIAEPLDFEAFIPRPSEQLRLISLPDAARGVIETLHSGHPFAGLTALVGPEGGFTSEEVAAALQAGFLPVRIAPTTLRIETAAAALAAIAAAFITERHPQPPPLEVT